MGAFITGTSAISPQHTFDNDLYLNELSYPAGAYLKCVEPDYKAFIDPKLSRRMAKIIKMGVTTAKSSMIEAGINAPEAIITGTGLGCLKDTEKFLASIIENEEEMLSPTSFIQSTHNTIGGQIALMLKCYCYNYTYVHRGHSFESALLDALMMMDEGTENVLIGGVDEMTPTSFDIMDKMGCVDKYEADLPVNIATNRMPVPGEGATFFVVSSAQSKNSYAEINGIRTFYRPIGLKAVEEQIEGFLNAHNKKVNEIDAVLVGVNGHKPDDDWYYSLSKTIFKGASLLSFKNLCGEYHTASAFALNLAAHMLKKQKVFDSTLINGKAKSTLNNILIYNHYKQKNHSIILVKKCDPTG